MNQFPSLTKFISAQKLLGDKFILELSNNDKKQEYKRKKKNN